MKLMCAMAGFLFSTTAFGLGGDLVVNASEEAKEAKNELGLQLTQPLLFGLRWWSLSTIGTTYYFDSNAHWAQTTQAVDLTMKSTTLGVSTKFEYDFQDKKTQTQYGLQLKVKLL